MNQLSYKDANGELVTKQQMAECINTGISTVCKIAEEAGAVNISRYEGHRYAFEIHQYT